MLKPFSNTIKGEHNKGNTTSEDNDIIKNGNVTGRALLMLTKDELSHHGRTFGGAAATVAELINDLQKPKEAIPPNDFAELRRLQALVRDLI